ncbi:hypothetical protein [Flavobacterium sp.]|uniref:hypothetical protein n=1 Tax=Flavobacterium sp. TaxID=239 RepID=UPI004048335E
MKKIYSLLAFITTIVAFGQAPQGFNYQATVRNSTGDLIINQNVNFRFNIMLNSPTSLPVFSETHMAPTDDLGQVNLVIGQGTPTTGTFSSINWGTGNYYLGIELNTGAGYIAMGTTQLLSVPYALYASNAGNNTISTPDLANVLAQANDANNIQIKNLADPTNSKDIVNKQYVDQLQAQITYLQQQITNNLIAQYPIGSVSCASGPTQIVPVLNPVTGKVWMDRNLGASRAATSSTDTEAYGDLYQWGRGGDGHQCRSSSTSSINSVADQPGHGDFIIVLGDWRSPENTNLWQGTNGINNPCPSGYRIPTEAELNSERLSWNTSNASGAFTSPIKLPLAGLRNNINGTFSSVGIYGFYWSSLASNGSSGYLYINGNFSGIGNFDRAYGLSVRCIKDTAGAVGELNCNGATTTGTLVANTAASDVISVVPYTGGNGGNHNGQTVNSTGVTGLTATLNSGTFATGSGSLTYTITGTPSAAGNASFELNVGGHNCILVINVNPPGPSYPAGTVHCNPNNPTAVVEIINPVTAKTWMDRNLGASQVASSVSDPSAAGSLYQWGRFSDGHQCRNSNTTTLVSSTDYPNHPDFILNHSYWMTPNNDNLWQGLNGINNPCPDGFRIPTIAEWEAERLSWTSNSATGAFRSPLKLVMGNFRNREDGNIQGFNFNSTSLSTYPVGLYWSSDLSSGATGSDGPIREGRKILFSDGSPPLVYPFANTYSVVNLGYRKTHGLSVRCIKENTSLVGTISQLNCDSFTFMGTIVNGRPTNVHSEVFYSGANGGFYDDVSINSSGVTGLTATVTGGEFNIGSGSIILIITGTPNSNGLAIFNLNIGGKSCQLIWTVLENENIIEQYPSQTVFCNNGEPTIINDIYNPNTGKIWMDRNLGATQVAQNKSDPNSYGDLYQWGRFGDGHHCRFSEVNGSRINGLLVLPENNSFIVGFDWINIPNDNLWQGVNGINNPCPNGYRLPTEAEFVNERNTWGPFNEDGAYNSILRLPKAGRRRYDNGIIESFDRGIYWTSTIGGTITVDGLNVGTSKYLSFNSVGASIGNLSRTYGHSVRCIKDSHVNQVTTLNCDSAVNNGELTSNILTSNTNTIISYTGGNGGEYNGQTVYSTGVTGLIATLQPGTLSNGSGILLYEITGTPNSSGVASFSISFGGKICTFIRLVNELPCLSTPTDVIEVINPITGAVWMDRNLGAYQQATSSNDGASYGDLYQWGRKKDGHQCRNSSTSTMISSLEEPSHGDFIISSSNWLNPQNDNLWQSINGVNNPCPSGFRLPSISELSAERSSWVLDNSNGAFTSVLKLPLTGRRNFSDGSFSWVGTIGYYWSSSVNGTSASYLNFSNGNSSINNFSRSYGLSVRCIKN